MRIFTELVDLVLPVSCVCCEQPGQLWCAGCRPASEPVSVAVAHGPPTVAAAEYAAELRTALLSYKERGHRALAAPLAGYLCDAVDVAVRAAGGSASLVLAPVPSTRAAARQRGGDHLRRLSRIAAREHRLRLAPVLRVTGRVLDSAGLSVPQRVDNLANSMTAVPGHSPVLIVDDIVTTGATLAEAGRALTAAGWAVAGAATIGATRRRWPAAQQTADVR